MPAPTCGFVVEVDGTAQPPVAYAFLADGCQPFLRMPLKDGVSSEDAMQAAFLRYPHVDPKSQLGEKIIARLLGDPQVATVRDRVMARMV